MSLKSLSSSLRSKTGLKLKRWLDDVEYRKSLDDESKQLIVDLFHTLYYEAGRHQKTWSDTRWRGTQVLKNPMDLWLYQEIISETRPDLIVETGTRFGGSAFYFASLCEMLGHGRVLSIDIEHTQPLPSHPRVEYFLGSSVADETLNHVRSAAEGAARVMVILDSDHSCDHVLRELRKYAPLVSTDSFMIVEDSNVNGHPVAEEFGPGPFEAIELFLKETNEFVIDERTEKFFFTFNPNGYLRKIS